MCTSCSLCPGPAHSKPDDLAGPSDSTDAAEKLLNSHRGVLLLHRACRPSSGLSGSGLAGSGLSGSGQAGSGLPGVVVLWVLREEGVELGQAADGGGGGLGVKLGELVQWACVVGAGEQGGEAGWVGSVQAGHGVLFVPP